MDHYEFNERMEVVIVPVFRDDFYIAVGGKVVAQIEFEKNEHEVHNEDSIIIRHTLVANGFRGKGIGKALVNRVVLYARKENVNIKPVCPFAKMVLESKVEYQDILVKSTL